MAPTDSDALTDLLDRHAAGDASARAGLLELACARLTRLTRHVLRDFPGVHRWEETDDVAQAAALRLWSALEAVRPATPLDFFRLAAVQIRRELIDLARRLQGPRGLAANYESRPPDSTGSGFAPEDLTFEPGRLAAWTEFHEAVERLDAAEREVFDLLWYQDMSQPDAARVLAVDERTVRRRWRAARLRMYQTLFGSPPGDASR